MRQKQFGGALQISSKGLLKTPKQAFQASAEGKGPKTSGVCHGGRLGPTHWAARRIVSSNCPGLGVSPRPATAAGFFAVAATAAGFFAVARDCGAFARRLSFCMTRGLLRFAIVLVLVRTSGRGGGKWLDPNGRIIHEMPQTRYDTPHSVMMNSIATTGE